MREAMLYDQLEDNRVRCNLCNHHCTIADQHRGICHVRENRGGRLYSLVYGRVIAANVDPIEKKPLFHLAPGTRSMSIATVGCNFRCPFCQNWRISQLDDEESITGHHLNPREVVALAERYGCRSISYTYTEPTVFFEYALDTGHIAHDRGLYNVFVTNGFMTKAALEIAKGWLDAANVDLKSFRDSSYRRLGGRLQPVLDSLRMMKEIGIWVEVTTLVVTNFNDSEEELGDIATFIADQLGKDTPWHVSRFHPDFRYRDAVPTPVDKIQLASRLGKEAGLRYVYSGNLPGDPGENTFCSKCGTLLIERYGFDVSRNIIENSTCPKCGTHVDGIEMSG